MWVKRVLPNGRAEFTRTFYVTFCLLVLGTLIACIGLVTAAIK